MACPEHRRVDADHPPFPVDKGTAGVSRIDGRVGLDQIGQRDSPFRIDDQLAAQRANDAGGNRVVEAKGIADRDYQLPDFELFPLRELGLREIVPST